ncbi:MAG: hypothetical protein AB7P00_19560 [Sandaracinaceae bacterium]
MGQILGRVAGVAVAVGLAACTQSHDMGFESGEDPEALFSELEDEQPQTFCSDAADYALARVDSMTSDQVNCLIYALFETSEARECESLRQDCLNAAEHLRYLPWENYFFFCLSGACSARVGDLEACVSDDVDAALAQWEQTSCADAAVIDSFHLPPRSVPASCTALAELGDCGPLRRGFFKSE